MVFPVHEAYWESAKTRRPSPCHEKLRALSNRPPTLWGWKCSNDHSHQVFREHREGQFAKNTVCWSLFLI